MDIGEGDIKVVKIHYLTVLQHAWIPSGHCQRTLRLKKGFSSNSVFTIGTSKSSYAASVPGTFHALETLGLPGTLCEEGGS